MTVSGVSCLAQCVTCLVVPVAMPCTHELQVMQEMQTSTKPWLSGLLMWLMLSLGGSEGEECSSDSKV